MNGSKTQTAFSAVGHYGSRDEIEREAPRIVNGVALTENASYCYDGRGWTLLTMHQYVTFRVVKRLYIAGRGHVTAIHNPDLLPISREGSAVCTGQYRLPIRGVEYTMTLTTVPRPKPYCGLVTSEPTTGDFVTVRMYPDEEDDPVSVEE